MSVDVPCPVDCALPAGGYPLLDPETIAVVTKVLVDLVKVRHGGRLSQTQLSELEGCVARQIVTAERLHGFALTNADEPAFTVSFGEGEPV